MIKPCVKDGGNTEKQIITLDLYREARAKLEEKVL